MTNWNLCGAHKVRLKMRGMGAWGLGERGV